MIPFALDALVLDRAAREADRPLYAFDERNEPVSAGEFADLAGRAAAVLATLGVGRGDRIAVWAENSLGWLVLLAAAAWRGAALVTVPTAGTPSATTWPYCPAGPTRPRPRR